MIKSKRQSRIAMPLTRAELRRLKAELRHKQHWIERLRQITDDMINQRIRFSDALKEKRDLRRAIIGVLNTCATLARELQRIDR